MKKHLYILSLILIQPVYAEVITDGSLGEVKSFSGKFNLPQSLGTTSGHNLFHSFKRFNLSPNESASFTGNASLKNVISRVTGGQVSNLNGRFSSKIGSANVYFINPAGIIVGANAQIDVPAALHLSTAAVLNFADGSQFSTQTSDSSLSISEPSSFGFLGQQDAEIKFQQAQLEFQHQPQISLSASRLNFEQGKILAPSAQLQLYAIGDESINIDLNSAPTAVLTGQLSFSSNSVLDVSGTNAGEIQIYSGDMNLENSKLIANQFNNTASIQKDNIQIQAQALRLSKQAEIKTNALANSHAGNINIKAQSLDITGERTGIFSRTLTPKTSSQSGRVQINVAENVDISAGGIIGVGTLSSGNAGQIDLTAKRLTLSNGGLINSPTWAGGKAGQINLTLAEELTINHQPIELKINDYFKASENVARFYSGTGVFSRAEKGSTGDAGKIVIQESQPNALQIEVLNRGKINSSSFGEGNASDVKINAHRLTLDGEASGLFSRAALFHSKAQAGKVNLKISDSIEISHGGIISVDTRSKGDAGNVNIETESLSLTNGGIINAPTWHSGNAGKISITLGDQLIINDSPDTISDPERFSASGDVEKYYPGTGIFSRAEIGSTGQSGEININSKAGQSTDIEILNKGRITTSSFGSGNADHININATSLKIQGENTGVFSRAIAAESNAEGGRVNINAQDVLVTDGGIIGADTRGLGDAGKISLSTENLEILNGGLITTPTWSQGNAGTIDISVKNKLRIEAQPENMSDSERFVASSEIAKFYPATGILSRAEPSSSGGNSGKIKIKDAQLITIKNGGIINTSTLASGTAGDVTIKNVKKLFIDAQNGAEETGILAIANAQSSGQAGSLNISANNIVLQNEGLLSIRSEPEVSLNQLSQLSATALNLNTQSLKLNNKAQISASALGNIPASAININADTIQLQDSLLTTAANNADAGAIRINSKQLALFDSQLTTSVAQQGNGGNIQINNQVLVLDGGFIQANTSGEGSLGGDIDISANILLTGNNQLLTGGTQRLSFESGLNVIQAASPDGVSGDVSLTSPQLDISGSISGLNSSEVELDDVVNNPCQNVSQLKSSLTRTSKGGTAVNETQNNFIPATKTSTVNRLESKTEPVKNKVPPISKAPCVEISQPIS